MKLKKISPALFALALLPSCVTVPNTTACSVAGRLSAGMICAETEADHGSQLDLDQTIEFLEPAPASSGQPARAGAICQSAADWNAQKTALEQACRELGSRCNYVIKEAIERAGLVKSPIQK